MSDKIGLYMTTFIPFKAQKRTVTHFVKHQINSKTGKHHGDKFVIFYHCGEREMTKKS